MNVVTVRQGTLYGPEYVTALRKQVKEHTGMDLVTLTDQTDTPGFKLWMEHGLEGWWSKLELFAPEWEFIRPCLFFDLDTYIRGDITDLLFEPERLWLIRDFNRPERSNSGVMVLPRRTHDIWNAAQKWGGDRKDGDFLNKRPHERLQDHFDGIVSYKRHAKEVPCGRIICFHGQPKPHQTRGWAQEHWMKYAHEG